MDTIGIALLHKLLRTRESDWTRVLVDANAPNPNRSYRGSYYATALAEIRGHASRRKTEAQLRERAAELRTRADREGERKGARWTNNARVIEDFLGLSLGRMRVLPLAKLVLLIDDVRFGVMPDLRASNGPKEKFFKFYCSADKPGRLDLERYQLIGQLSYEATKDVKGVEPEDIRIIDLARATALPGAIARSNLREQLRQIAKRVKELPGRDTVAPSH
jgi:hypothetical protein